MSLDVARLDELLLGGALGPDAGVAVGLELLPHRHRVLQRLVAAHRLADLVVGAQQVLQVVAVLVGQHVGLGEVARGAEPVAQVAVEAHVDVGVGVGRAIERPDVGRGLAAPGVDRAGEHAEDGGLVREPVGSEHLGEGALDIVDDVVDEVVQLLLVGVERRGRPARAGAGRAATAAAHQREVDAEGLGHQRHQRQERSGSAPDLERGRSTATLAADILDVLRLVAAFPLHRSREYMTRQHPHLPIPGAAPRATRFRIGSGSGVGSGSGTLARRPRLPCGPC
ncbi:MAG: hypothetical protein R3B06_01790 [Kofleriaceae bacterium]